MKAHPLSFSSRSVHLAILAVIACGLGLSVMQRGLLEAIAPGPARGQQILGFDVPLWLIWLPLSPIIVLAGRRWTFRHAPLRDLAAHVAVAIALAVIHTLAFTALRYWVSYVPGRESFMMVAAGMLSWRLAVDAFVYATILGATLVFATASPAPPNVGSSPAAVKWHRNPNRPIAVVDGTRTILFEQSEVSMIEAADYYAKVYARGRTWLVRESLDSLEARLASPPFFRAHRSAIVNVRFVTDLMKLSRHRHEAVLRDGTRVAVSAERRTKLEELLSPERL